MYADSYSPSYIATIRQFFSTQLNDNSIVVTFTLIGSQVLVLGV